MRELFKTCRKRVPPRPTILSTLRIAYTAVRVLTTICHGVNLAVARVRRVRAGPYDMDLFEALTQKSVKPPEVEDAWTARVAVYDAPEPEEDDEEHLMDVCEPHEPCAGRKSLNTCVLFQEGLGRPKIWSIMSGNEWPRSLRLLDGAITPKPHAVIRHCAGLACEFGLNGARPRDPPSSCQTILAPP